ncbi:type 4a pilus biogenesis protein PilO [Geomonas edaphica]|uniref:type 4a pilus biogenesis protein PilO n=1 Tax=Geomonas edaphica TaxID=2570226 RepID=UPI0010A84CC2|nr:type 4a pilus biogenesis protein PilO [Geomonas edaphica]
MNFQTILDMIAARRKAFIFLAFLLLIAVGIEMYLTTYQGPQLAARQQEWFARRDALARGETEADAARYQRGMRDLEQFRKLLIPKRDFAAVLGRIYETASRNALSLQGISYKPGQLIKGTQVLPYTVSFQVSGKYGAVKNFLADMARFPEMVTVDTISIGNQKTTQEKVDLKLQTTVYLLTEGA